MQCSLNDQHRHNQEYHLDHRKDSTSAAWDLHRDRVMQIQLPDYTIPTPRYEHKTHVSGGYTVCSVE